MRANSSLASLIVPSVVPFITRLFIIGICIFTAYQYLINSRAEYQLHKITESFDKLSDDNSYVSSKQRLKLLEGQLVQLDSIKVTQSTEHRINRLSAQILGQLSELAIWNKQRRQHSKRALELMRSNLIANRYNMINWMLALDLEQSTNSNSSDRDWMLANLQHIGSWSNDVNLYSGFYCLVNWQAFQEALKQQCSKTVLLLSKDKQLANKLRYGIREMPQAKRVMEGVVRAN